MDSSGHLKNLHALIKIGDPERLSHVVCDTRSRTELKLALAWFFDSVELASVSQVTS
jgi:hypothetical protein